MSFLRQPRYIEISARNPISRILVGGARCVGDVIMRIERSGSSKCGPQYKYNACCQLEKIAMCDTFVAEVCALEIDAKGYAVFEWPSHLMDFKEGWYTGTILMDGCHSCGTVPIRIGPRCNVLHVETAVLGPDSLCTISCDDDGCPPEICPPRRPCGEEKTIYIPDEV